MIPHAGIYNISAPTASASRARRSALMGKQTVDEKNWQRRQKTLNRRAQPEATSSYIGKGKFISP
jgi:hypothetical protein